MPLTVCIVW